MVCLDALLSAETDRRLSKVGFQRYLQAVRLYREVCVGGAKAFFEKWLREKLQPDLAAWSEFVNDHPECGVEASRVVDQALFHLDTLGETRPARELGPMVYSALAVLRSGLEQLHSEARLNWSQSTVPSMAVHYTQLLINGLHGSTSSSPTHWPDYGTARVTQTSFFEFEYLRVAEEVPTYNFVMPQEARNARKAEPSYTPAA